MKLPYGDVIGATGFFFNGQETMAQQLNAQGTLRNPFLFAPGEQYCYTNANFNLAGYIIEKVSTLLQLYSLEYNPVITLISREQGCNTRATLNIASNIIDHLMACQCTLGMPLLHGIAVRVQIVLGQQQSCIRVTFPLLIGEAETERGQGADKTRCCC